MDLARRKAIHDAMVRLSDGDRSAFDTLLDDLWPAILSFAQRQVDNAADAEDIAQEVFLKVCSRIADFDRERDGLSWSFAIASYEIMTHRRRVQRRREVYDEPSLAVRVDGAASQEERLLAREVGVAIEQAARALTDDDRMALGLNDAKLAGSMGPTMRKRKQRALGRLRSLWRQIYGES